MPSLNSRSKKQKGPSVPRDETKVASFTIEEVSFNMINSMGKEFFVVKVLANGTLDFADEDVLDTFYDPDSTETDIQEMMAIIKRAKEIAVPRRKAYLEKEEAERIKREEEREARNAAKGLPSKKKGSIVEEDEEDFDEDEEDDEDEF